MGIVATFSGFAIYMGHDGAVIASFYSLGGAVAGYIFGQKNEG